jgi:hypothetical protein
MPWCPMPSSTTSRRSLACALRPRLRVAQPSTPRPLIMPYKRQQRCRCAGAGAATLQDAWSLRACSHDMTRSDAPCTAQPPESLFITHETKTPPSRGHMLPYLHTAKLPSLYSALSYSFVVCMHSTGGYKYLQNTCMLPSGEVACAYWGGGTGGTWRAPMRVGHLTLAMRSWFGNMLDNSAVRNDVTAPAW